MFRKKESRSDTQVLSLIEAVKQNNQEEFLRLLNSDTSNLEKIIDEIDVERGGNALYWASACGHIHFIGPLIKAGINVNQPNKRKETPVYVAAQKGHAKVIELLKTTGLAIDIDAPDFHGATPAYIAAQHGNSEAIMALKAAGANMDKPVDDGSTPLCVAAYHGDVPVINALKAAGAKMDAVDLCGRTAAYTAAAEGHAEAIAALNVAGANIINPPVMVGPPLVLRLKKARCKPSMHLRL